MIEELKKYRESPALSQSFLKKILTNDTKEDKKPKIQFLIGSLVDCLITTPELVNDWFYISQIEKYPAPQIKEVFDTYYAKLVEDEVNIEWNDALLLETYRQVSNSRKKDETVLEDLKKEEEYWNDLSIANGRSIVSQEYWNRCNLVASSLMSNPEVNKYIVDDLFQEVMFQAPLYWKYTSIDGEVSKDCKGLLDCYIMNHKEKTVQIVDIKTTSDSLDGWKYNIARRFRYDFQLSYYFYGMQKYIDANLPGYRQLNPVLIVENVNYYGKPRIYELTDDDLYIGTYGCERQNKVIIFDRDIDNNVLNADWEMQKIHGWKDAIEIYNQCQLLGLPDYDLTYYQNKGKFALNLWT